MSPDVRKTLAESLKEAHGHLYAMDHHWAELAAAGMDLNRVVAAVPEDERDAIMALKHRIAEFVKSSHGAAYLAIDTRMLMDQLTRKGTAACRKE